MPHQEQKNEARIGGSGLNAGLDDVFVPDPRPSHAELLSMIGEIDGIDLESERYGVAVYMHIGGKKLKIIYGGGEIISHHITRTGIACCIGSANVK